MKRFALTITLLAFLAVSFPMHVGAQGMPHVVDSLRPVSDDIRAAVDALLATSAPVNVPAYVITYVKQRGKFAWALSLVAVQPYSTAWHLDEDVVWWGAVDVTYNGHYRAEFALGSRPDQPKVAAPWLPLGGGPLVRLPFQPARSMFYGTRGVHGGTLGTNGMVAIDLMGGSTLGAGIASDSVYASDAGVIDTVCDDGTTIGIRTYNSTTGEYFVYLHLVDNANLEIGHVFQKGEVIGVLTHGSFDDTCGTADQKDSSYHLHFGFMPDGAGKYRFGDYTLDTATGKFTSQKGDVRPGQWLYADDVPGVDDPDSSTDIGFWDFILAGLIGGVAQIILEILPDHEDLEFLATVINGITAVFAITYVLTKGSTTLYPVFFVVGVIIAMELIRIAIMIIAVIFRIIKLLPFA